MTQFDSSEIVKHLRSVHFSLVAVCILVSLALIGGSQSVARTAHEQFQKVLAIKDNWPNWTQKYCKERLKWIKEHDNLWASTINNDIYIPSEQIRTNVFP